MKKLIASLGLLFVLNCGGDDDQDTLPNNNNDASGNVGGDAGGDTGGNVGGQCQPTANEIGIGEPCTEAEDEACVEGTVCNLFATVPYCTRSETGDEASCANLDCGPDRLCCEFVVPAGGIGKTATCVVPGCEPTLPDTQCSPQP